MEGFLRPPRGPSYTHRKHRVIVFWCHCHSPDDQAALRSTASLWGRGHTGPPGQGARVSGSWFARGPDPRTPTGCAWQQGAGQTLPGLCPNAERASRPPARPERARAARVTFVLVLLVRPSSVPPPKPWASSAGDTLGGVFQIGPLPQNVVTDGDKAEPPPGRTPATRVARRDQQRRTDPTPFAVSASLCVPLARPPAVSVCARRPLPTVPPGVPPAAGSSVPVTRQRGHEGQRVRPRRLRASAAGRYLRSVVGTLSARSTRSTTGPVTGTFPDLQCPPISPVSFAAAEAPP